MDFVVVGAALERAVARAELDVVTERPGERDEHVLRTPLGPDQRVGIEQGRVEARRVAGLPIGRGVGAVHARRVPDLEVDVRGNLRVRQIEIVQGVAEVRHPGAERGKQKGPTLRALSSRAPYFHNGAADTLREVIDFYNRRFAIGFTAQEINGASDIIWNVEGSDESATTAGDHLWLGRPFNRTPFTAHFSILGSLTPLVGRFDDNLTADLFLYKRPADY